jgi:hypothetical protein
MQTLRTNQQQEIVNRLVQTFHIDGAEVLFLNKKDPTKPWLRARTLASIARSSGKFKVVRGEFEQYIEPLKQVVYQGTLVDLDDRVYSLPGVATVDEKIRIDATDETVDAHDLAEARALRSTFELAGFDPFDSNSVVPLGDNQPAGTRDVRLAEAESRLSDFARIKILARDKGLIVGKDASGYRKFLVTNYEGATSAAGFDPVMRKSLIEALERYQPTFDPSSMPEEFAETEPQGVPV